jgi:Xaa-Pro aminopeptidase
MRLQAVRDILAEENADGFLISSYENRRYVSGFSGSAGLILVTEQDAILYVDGRYTLQAKIETKDFEVMTGPFDSFAPLKSFKIKKLLVEEENLTLAKYNKLKAALPDTQIVCASSMLAGMRMIKTKQEISAIKKAAEIADKAFYHILNYIKPGVSEKEIALELEYYMIKNGAEGTSFDTIAAASERSALPHASPSDRLIKYGDVLLMDYGCKWGGYCSDITRTVSVGKANDDVLRVYQTVLNAQKAGLESIKAGMPCINVDKAARGIIEEAGFGPDFTHSFGHGVGIAVHEQPYLSPSAKDSLRAGNVVTAEPGIYLENRFGVRIEDLVVVTADGHVNLTGATKDFLEL